MDKTEVPKLPLALKSMSLAELQVLVDELRQEIIATSLRNGGHLGASLGTVELATALHFVFDSPEEPLVWDVGHQAYAHKLLTGRRERFGTLRQLGGISGFLSREESPHDVWGAGHSSTALSAAIAMAFARAGSTRWSVAIVGDGGLTAGLALEALNNARISAAGPLLLVVNDNQMSISPNVGAIPRVLAGAGARDFFELFDFEYHGPIDGHDLEVLIATLQRIRSAGSQGLPVVLHVRTQKGRGYAPAEESPAAYHGVSPMVSKPAGGATGPKAPSYSEAFGRALCDLAERDPKIVAITAAMAEGTGLLEFARRFPDRFFDVGIAEPHAVTFAAGLATQGFRPVVAIYSTFLQRSLDAIIHDVAVQGLGVTFAIDRAGLVGADGPTHHGAFDLAYLGIVPGMTVFAPSCLHDMSTSLEVAIHSGRPAAIRYPRGGGPAELPEPETKGVRWLQKRSGPVVAVGLGAAVPRLLEAAAGLDVSVVGVTCAKPLPEALLAELRGCANRPCLVVEDGALRGGFGEHLQLALGERSAPMRLRGYGDQFYAHGTPAELEDQAGVSVAQLRRALEELLGGRG